MRKILLAAATTAVLVLSVGDGLRADTLPAGGIEGCVVTGPAAPERPPVDGLDPFVYAETCTFTAERGGGYVARGDWNVTIQRPILNPDGTPVLDDEGNETFDTIVAEDGTHEGTCTTAILPKDTVTATLTGDGYVATGNPVPEGAPSTTAEGEEGTPCPTAA